MGRLFISHSSANNAEALALRIWLAENGLDDVFLDVDPDRGLIVGERWQAALKTATDRCEAVLFLVSRAWVESKWCLAEFLLAKTLHKRIFGLVIEKVPLERIPVEMTAEWQLCELTADGTARSRSFESDLAGVRTKVVFRESALELLRRGLERAGLDARSFPWPPPNDPSRAPYRGLSALDTEDAAIFFGRDAMIVRALDRVRGLVDEGVQKALVVLGASGSGKSSFVRAGLLPRLARDDLIFLPLPIIRPASAVISGDSGLATALAGAAERLGSSHARGRIKEMIASGSGAVATLLLELADLAKRRAVMSGPDKAAPTIVLAVDQAEELFNAEGTDEAATFIKLLSELLCLPPGPNTPRFIVLITIRSDRYELLQAQEQLAEIKRELFDLPSLPPSEFKTVIEGPASRLVAAGGRLTIDPALTERLISDAAGADALPLLSFTLERLYADYGREGRLTLAEYEALGGVQGSIEAAVAKALADPSRAPEIPASKEAQLASLRGAFIPWLARIAPDTGAPMRRLARIDEIPQASRAMIERLVEARLLVADRRSGIDIVEVAHESLLRRWPALAAWLEADAGDLKVIEGVEVAASEWTRNGRQEAWLDHRAERLDAAIRLTGRDDFLKRLGDEGGAYLFACREREEGERKEKEAALVREQQRLGEIAAAQTRTARNQKIARLSLLSAGVAVVVGLLIGLWQRQTNLELSMSLNTQQATLARARTNLFVELAQVERLRGNIDAAMRFAVYAVVLESQQPAVGQVLADVELSTALYQAGWRLSLGGHSRSIASAVFSPDGAHIVTASLDGTARVWNAADGKQLYLLTGHQAGVWTAVFSPDGKWILTASEDKTARIWDAATGQPIATLQGHEDKVTSASFSPDGARIVTGSFDKTARIWDAKTAQQLAVLRGHDNTVQSVFYSHDGTRIVTSSDDATARVWDARTAEVKSILRGHEKAVYCAIFSPNDALIATGSADNTARIWDVQSAREVRVLKGHEEYVNVVEFSPTGAAILTASADHTARLWEVASGNELNVFRGHEDYVNSASFRSDGGEIVTASRDMTARIWPIAQRVTGTVLTGHTDYVNSGMFSPDATTVVTASQDRTAKIWDVASGHQILSLAGHAAGLHSARFSPDGARIVTASEDRTARIWNAMTGAEVQRLSGHENWVMSAEFSPDGNRILTASWDKTARLWDALSGAQLATMPHDDVVYEARFSPDGSKIVTGSQDKTVRVFDAISFKQLVAIRIHEGPVYSVAFDRGGTRIVSGSQDRTARVWDAITGEPIVLLRGHDLTVVSVAFGSDGNRILTASSDKTARIWDLKTARELSVLRGHQQFVTSAAFNSDGKKIVTASRDRTARLWEAGAQDIPINDLLHDACTRRLAYLSKLTLDDMKLAGFSGTAEQIDVCSGLH